jgi:hypothetical protein
MLFRIIFLALLFIPINLFSQLRGNNLYEFQFGNVPYQDPSDLTTHYNQLNLLYTYKKLTASVRYEQFLHPDQEKEYYQLSQYSLAFRDKGMDIKIGHLNETLGNGILLRSFEIPSSIFEDQAYRIRQGFYRDLKGFKAGYNHKFFSLKIVRARSLLNLLPPGIDDEFRRPDLSEALEFTSRILKQKIGFILLRNTNNGNADNFFSGFAAGSFLKNFSYNIEIAKKLGQHDISWFDDLSSYGIYGSLNYSSGNLGISLEYKDYKNIFIGAGISDPPTLVREQNYKVLNRSTHVPELSDESGYQAELYYSFPGGHFLTLNHSASINELIEKFVFREFFAEYQHSFESGNILKFFADYSQDPLQLEFNRYSGGFISEIDWGKGYGTALQFEYQQFKREDFLNADITNMVGIIGLHNTKQSSISIIYELSTDPIQTDNPNTFDIEEGVRHFIGLESSFKINKANKLSVFAGQRRGGPACTSGICYEVLDFEGVELRLTTKF